MKKIIENFLVLEGCDKTGKDTVRNLIIQKTKGKILIIVRAEFSQIVYSRLFERNINEKFFVESIRKHIEEGWKYFIFTATDKVIKKRCLIHNEKDIVPEQIAEHKKAFFDLIDELQTKYKIEKGIYIIDTSIDTPEETTQKIIDKLEKE